MVLQGCGWRVRVAYGGAVSRWFSANLPQVLSKVSSKPWWWVFLEGLWHGKKMKNALVKEIRVKSVLQLIPVGFDTHWLHVCEVSFDAVPTST